MLEKIIRGLVAFLMLISPALPNKLGLPAIPSGQKLNLDDRFELVWSDEFTGDKLDKTKWCFPWWITQRKGGFWHEDMVRVEGGNLIISTDYKAEPLKNYYYDDWHDKIDFKEYKSGYYSACIETSNLYEQKYGYFEVRCILPKSAGMWSAFWFMNEGVYNVDGSGEDGTEIDVFESMYCKDSYWGAGNAVASNLHFDGYNEGHQYQTAGKYFVNNPYEEFNTYGLEWNENEYIFYINGVESGRSSFGGVSKNPEHMILSCEVSGEDGVPTTKRGNTIDKDNMPADFIVDYVRAYQYK